MANFNVLFKGNNTLLQAREFPKAFRQLKRLILINSMDVKTLMTYSFYALYGTIGYNLEDCVIHICYNYLKGS